MSTGTSEIDDQHRHQREDVLVDVLADGVAEEVAQHREADGPDERADDVVEEERPPRHLADAGQRRGEGPDDRHETGDHDRSRTVLLEERLRPFDVCLFEDAGVRLAEQPWSEPLADREAHLVAQHRSDEAAEHHHRDVELSLPREDARGEQQRVAGQEETDQQTGLGEHDDPQRDLRVRTQRVDEFLDVEPEDCEQRAVHGASL